MNELYRTLRRAIRSGKTDGIVEKIEYFTARGDITAEQRDELMELLNGK